MWQIGTVFWTELLGGVGHEYWTGLWFAGKKKKKRSQSF